MYSSSPRQFSLLLIVLVGAVLFVNILATTNAAADRLGRSGHPEVGSHEGHSPHTGPTCYKMKKRIWDNGVPKWIVVDVCG
jgi:hypothetical protein